MLASRFRVLCADSGLSIDDTARLLRVTPRTVRYWFSGKTAVPYAAYKLVRIMHRWELPGDAWKGWHMHSGKLWTPEGYGFGPQDSSWWSLLVRQAQCFRSLIARTGDFEVTLLKLGADGLLQTLESVGRDAERPGAGRQGEAAARTGTAQPSRPALPGGRRSRPALDLSNKHIGASIYFSEEESRV